MGASRPLEDGTDGRARHGGGGDARGRLEELLAARRPRRRLVACRHRGRALLRLLVRLTAQPRPLGRLGARAHLAGALGGEALQVGVTRAAAQPEAPRALEAQQREARERVPRARRARAAERLQHGDRAADGVGARLLAAREHAAAQEGDGAPEHELVLREFKRREERRRVRLEALGTRRGAALAARVLGGAAAFRRISAELARRTRAARAEEGSEESEGIRRNQEESEGIRRNKTESHLEPTRASCDCVRIALGSSTL